MRLSAPNGDFVRLRIAGYEFPDAAEALYDSNWLIIEGEAQVAGRAWRFRDPSLLTYEAAELAVWLDGQAGGGEPGDEIGFIEPNLCFVRAAPEMLRTVLWAECKPPWASAYGPECFVETPAEPALLRAAAASLRDALLRFPQRAER